ncbi:MAG: hypothetical protein Q9166_005266 [cf. Caloplaca sp. 2 TL-2023]
MSTESLSARLQSLYDAHKQTVYLIHRLSKHHGSPGSSSLDPEAGDARLELATEIHQSLKEQHEDFDLLRQEVEDQTNTASWVSSARSRDSEKERERTDLAAQIARLGEDLKMRAQLQAKRNVEAAKQKERELLFVGVQQGAIAPNQGRRKGQERLSKDQLELNASADVTAALRRVHSLMKSEVSRSQFALETLHQSTAALSTLSESYTKLDKLLSSSRSLVSTLVHSQKSDTWYLESAFWILVLTIGWLVFRRILYGPGWWLLYLPTTLLWRAATSIIRLFLGASAFVFGAVGAKNQSITLNQAFEQVFSTPHGPPSATGEIPTFNIGMSAPSIHVGGGGKGQPPPQKPQDGYRIISDEVGEMAQKTSETTSSSSSSTVRGNQGTVLRQRAPDEHPNPKKRMWKETAAVQGDSRPRDEL